jgi:hypothetical protein
LARADPAACFPSSMRISPEVFVGRRRTEDFMPFAVKD